MPEYIWKCEDNVVSGLWKFDHNASLEELQAVALEWKQQDPDEWEQLYIRGVGKNRALGIGFRYWLHGVYHDPEGIGAHSPPAKEREKFFHKMTDILKRRFGNSFVGWDLSEPTWTLDTVESR